MQEQPTISIDEFKKLAGKDAELYSDEQLSEIINHLEVLAEMFINNSKRADTNPSVGSGSKVP